MAGRESQDLQISELANWGIRELVANGRTTEFVRESCR